MVPVILPSGPTVIAGSHVLVFEPTEPGTEIGLLKCAPPSVERANAIPPAIVEEFARRKWRYVRRFNGLLGFKWEVVFGTTQRSGVETYCRENAMACQWSDDGALTVTYVRDAVREHPATGERVWFNHGLFFNPISIEPALREALLESFSPEELPYNTFFGDGQPVPLEVLSEIRKAYDAETRQFDWHRGDVLMLDNMLTAHGRSAYSGTRQVVAGLAESHALPLEELSAATRSVAMVCRRPSKRS